MSELTARHHDPGVLPGVRDAVRALLVMDEGTTWQLPDGDVSEGLAFLGQARQLLEVAEVALVREGIWRGLPDRALVVAHRLGRCGRPADPRPRRCRDRGRRRGRDRIVPVMLGTESEPLELGRATRYFTLGQRRLLVLRDGGCTYPGCTMPAQWTDAHHLTHWSRGGHTDIANAALLCERHHTHVHVPDLTATARGVTWHV